MGTSDNSSKCNGGGDYLTKQVLLNGQFVTLYSLNGHTWLSSPEDIPALMDRLENERMALFNGEKASQTDDSKEKGGEKSAEKSNATPSTKYRMKGPKPRPILEQNGKIFKGPAVEPVSASDMVMKFSSDLPEGEAPRKSSASAKVLTKSKVKKLLSEVTDTPGKVKKGGARKSTAKQKSSDKVSVAKPQKAASKTKVKKKASDSRTSPKATRKTSAAKVKKPVEKKKSTGKPAVRKSADKKTSTNTKSKPTKASASGKAKSGSPSSVKTAKKSSNKKSTGGSKSSARQSSSKKGKAR